MSTSTSHHLLRSASLMGIATFLSRIMGLVREQVFAYLFGAGNATDAFNIAFRIPNLLRDLFAEGAMSASLVPTFTRVRAKEGDERAWRVAGLVFRVLLGLTALLALLGIIFAEPLVNLYASAFKQVPGKFELTVHMTQIIFPFFPLIALAAAFMGILNTCGRFFLPAFSSALFNITSVFIGIICAWILPGYGVEPIVGMAIGVVAGGLVQAFCQLPSLYGVGYRWQKKESKFPPWYKDPALKKMLVLLLPGMVGLAATQINVLINSILATSQGPGAVSWLNYSFRLMQFPIGIFGVSLAAATLPTVSRLWVHKNTNEIASTLTLTLKRVFAINLPASAGLAFLGYPIIQLLFEYGRFTPEDTRHTALALAAYATGLTAYSCVKVLVPACYALNNTRLSVISSLLSVLLTLILNLLMIGPFGYVGLALGTSIAALFNAIFLMIAIQKILHREKGQFLLAPLVQSFLGYLFISLLMGGICLLTYSAINSFFSDHILMRVLETGILVSEGILITLCLSRLTRMTELSDAFTFFVDRFKKKLFSKSN